MLLISYRNTNYYQIPWAYYFCTGGAVTGPEVITGTENAQLTCTVSGVINPPTIKWTDGSGTIGSDANFEVGTVSLTGNTAVSILTVKKAITATTTYTCIGTATEWGKFATENSAELNVFSELYFLVDVSTILLTKTTARKYSPRTL